MAAHNPLGRKLPICEALARGAPRLHATFEPPLLEERGGLAFERAGYCPVLKGRRVLTTQRRRM